MSQQNRTFSMQPLLHEGPPISSAWPLLHGASGAQAPNHLGLNLAIPLPFQASKARSAGIKGPAS
jgi:hypothetical protein